MAYGSIKSISDSILESTDGESIQEQIDAYMQSTKSGTTGDGVIANAAIRKDAGAIVKSLGARAKVVAEPAVVIDRAASVTRDWTALMMANDQDNSAINAAFLSDEISANASSAPETTDEAYLQTGVPPAGIATETTGLMSKPYDADRMMDANITADTGNTIIASSYLKDNSIAENGVFSQAALETSVSNTTDNNTYNAMILGNIVKETGALTADGPKTETGYGRLTGAELAKDRRTKGRGTGPEATARNAAYIALDSNPAFTNPNTGSREGDRAVKDAMIFDIWYDDDHREAGLKLGNTQPGDGSLFKGRGLLQITGRDNYKKVQDQLAKSGIEVDLMANPEYVLDDKYALAVAIAFLEVTPEKGINKNNINELGPYKMSRLINAGEGNTAALDRWSRVTGILTGTDAQNATDANEKTAQTKAGITGDDVDGNIGPASVRAFEAYLVDQGITIPKGASKYDLVRLVNQA